MLLCGQNFELAEMRAQSWKDRPMTDFTVAAMGAARMADSNFVEVAARAVAVPLRELYVLLWRAGVMEIAD